ncbi:hypothetical protein EDC01DRAFT_643319 [Geopyxis carbonaria]|nr:hypothetical protein EDC01DRAFT_643319 [Geopyxis carbonaria]
MTEVHEALKALAPTEHHAFPDSPAVVDVHLASHLASTHTLIASIPPPAAVPPGATLPAASTLPPAAAALQKDWKPVKLSAKDNPLDISVFKLAAKDGKGSWFARRSIHTDVPFARFKAGLQAEFACRDGDAPVRGIGKEECVRALQGELGRAEVLVLRAQFPGPSAPRVFVEGYLSSAAHPEDLRSATDTTTAGEARGKENERDAKDRPKQFTIISKPVLDHPDVEERPGHVQGIYESVEFIRELPLSAPALSRSQSTPNVPAAAAAAAGRARGKTVTATPEESENPCAVEWIMVTRSDPGGSVPRWMVERGTPGGIVKDAEKFLNWCRAAEHLDAATEAEAEATEAETARGKALGENDEVAQQAKRHLTERAEDAKADLATAAEGGEKEGGEKKSGGGILATALNTVSSGVVSLASSAVSGKTLTPPASDDSPPLSDSSESDTASMNSFTTAALTAPSLSPTPSLTSSTAPHSLTPTPSTKTAGGADKTPEDRALAQFLKDKTKLEAKLHRDVERRSEKERKATEKHLKSLEKRERKYRRAVEKADERRRKEEEKREKSGGGGGSRGEVEELKRVVEGLTRENVELRKRVEELERERTEIGRVLKSEK